MKKIQMNKKSLVWNLIGITLVILMVFLAMKSPSWIQTYMDQNAEKKVEGFELEAQTYEQKYTSFSEEMKLLANEMNWNGIQLVPVTDNMEQISNEQLTKAVNQELYNIITLTDLAQKMMVSSDQLIVRERYSLYSQDNENKLNGLEIWKLEYSTEQQSIKVVMDVNFQKIYMINISKNDISIFDFVDWDLDSYFWNQTNDYYLKLKEEEDESPKILCFSLKEYTNVYSSKTYEVDEAEDRLSKIGLAKKAASAKDFGMPEDSSLLVYYYYNILGKNGFEMQSGIYQFEKMLQL